MTRTNRIPSYYRSALDYILDYSHAAADLLDALAANDTEQETTARERLRKVGYALHDTTLKLPYAAIEEVTDAPTWLLALLMLNAGVVLEPRLEPRVGFEPGRGIAVRTAIAVAGDDDMQDDEMRRYIDHGSRIEQIGMVSITPDPVEYSPWGHRVLLTRAGLCALLGAGSDIVECGPERRAAASVVSMSSRWRDAVLRHGW